MPWRVQLQVSGSRLQRAPSVMGRGSTRRGKAGAARLFGQGFLVSNHLNVMISALNRQRETTSNFRSKGQNMFLKMFHLEQVFCFSNYYAEGGEALAQVAQRSCGCPLPGSVQGQVGWGSEQPGLVEGVPAHGRGVGAEWSVRSLPTQTIQWLWCLLLIFYPFQSNISEFTYKWK